jgi:hypothetical protein
MSYVDDIFINDLKEILKKIGKLIIVLSGMMIFKLKQNVLSKFHTSMIYQKDSQLIPYVRLILNCL